MRRVESRQPDQQEEPIPESGERRKKAKTESKKEAPELSSSDRFELDADRYNDIRDSVSEKRSELRNLELNPLTSADKEASGALEEEIETLESQAVVIEKSYGKQAAQFVTDAGRQKNIRTEMDLATRKMGAIERVMKRGEFPGGDEAAVAEMDVQAERITRANRELQALKGMYEAANANAPKAERKPKATAPRKAKKNSEWMSNTGTSASGTGTPESTPFNPAETDEAVKMAMEMSAESARKQQEAEAPFVEAEPEDEVIELTDTEIEDVTEAAPESEPIPLTREIDHEPMPLMTGTEKLAADQAKEMSAAQSRMEAARGTEMRLKHELADTYGIDDPEAELANRATKPLRSFFRRLFNNEKDAAKDKLLAEYDKASKERAQAEAALNEERNRKSDAGQQAMRMRGSSGSRMGSGEGRGVDQK